MGNVKIEQIHLSTSTVANVFKLPQYMIDYLWECIDVAKKKKINVKKDLAGYISKSYKLGDPQNLISKHLMEILLHPQSPAVKNIQLEIEKVQSKFSRARPEHLKLEPCLNSLWVNFQKKGEFQPVHHHAGVFSFVIWMDIPYNWKNDLKLSFTESNCEDEIVGSFNFLYSQSDSRSVRSHGIPMSPSMNGYCCFFPSDLCHQVYPFYTSDKERISISGNIVFDTVETPEQRSQQNPFLISNT
jgi:hypothetical protein